MLGRVVSRLLDWEFGSPQVAKSQLFCSQLFCGAMARAFRNLGISHMGRELRRIGIAEAESRAICILFTRFAR